MGCRRNNSYIYQNRGDGTSFCSKCSSYSCKCIKNNPPVSSYISHYKRTLDSILENDVSSTTSDSPKYLRQKSRESTPPLDLRTNFDYTPFQDFQANVVYPDYIVSQSSKQSPKPYQSPKKPSPAFEKCRSVISSPKKSNVSSTNTGSYTYLRTSPKRSITSKYYSISTYCTTIDDDSPSSPTTSCGDSKTISSSDYSLEMGSSPMYCSTSVSSNSLSSQTFTFSSPEKCVTPTQFSRKYIPLSPNLYSPTSPKLTYRNTDFGEYSPLSPTCCSSPTSCCSPQFRTKTPEHTFMQYTPPSQFSPERCYSPQYKLNLDYSLNSPQSFSSGKYSVQYSPPSSNYILSSISPNDNNNRPKSPTFIDNSPISPIYGHSSPSYAPASPQYSSPEYSPISWSYFHSSGSNNDKRKSPSYVCEESPACPYVPYSPNKYYSDRSRTYRSNSPTYYPLSPEYTPLTSGQFSSTFTGIGIDDDDIPCICCSPPKY